MRQSGEWDIDEFENLVPAKLLDKWSGYFASNPTDAATFYKFFAHAFVELAKAFHLSSYAMELRWTDFVWWEEPEEEDDSDYWDDDESAERNYEICSRIYNGPGGKQQIEK